MNRLKLGTAAILICQSVSSAAGNEMPIEFEGLPMPLHRAGPVQFETGNLSGYIAGLTSLPAAGDGLKLGFERLFVELDGSLTHPASGLRVFAGKSGIVGARPAGFTVIAEDLAIGSRPGSPFHAFAGLLPEGAALAVAERMRLHNPDSADEVHIRAWNIRLASGLIRVLLPYLPRDTGMWDRLGTDLGVTLTPDGAEMRLALALAVTQDGENLLRISGNGRIFPDSHIEVSVMVGEHSPGGAVIPIAELLAGPEAGGEGDSQLLRQIRDAARKFAATGTPTELKFSGTLPVAAATFYLLGWLDGIAPVSENAASHRVSPDP
ncbi:MAG: hypothetical protein OXF74_07150 [Rhodobacteraceae bacterium]|nr:hypothetical protein [Paracoccaceae bacterium]